MAAAANKTYGGNILEAFLPKAKDKSSSSSSQTTSTDVSAEGINELIRQMMEGDSGLANLLTGQQSRGLYNSTTAKLLADDLAARVAGKAAIAKAPTTVTQNTSTTNTNANAKPNAKYSAGMELLGKILNSDGGQKLASSAFEVIGSGLKSIFGMDSGNSSGSSLGSSPANKAATYASDPYSSPAFTSALSGGNFASNSSPDYFSTSIFGPKNNFGQDDDEFALDTLGLGSGSFDFSSGLGMDGFDFSPFTLGDYSLMSSGGSSYKSTDSYSSPSFSSGGGVSFSGGSNGSSGLTFGFSF